MKSPRKLWLRMVELMQKVRLTDPSVLPECGILSARDVHALCDASAVMDAVDQWAEARKSEHLLALDASLTEATERAYADGLRDLGRAVELYRTAASKMEHRLSELLAECLYRVFHEHPPAELLRATVTPVLATISAGEEVAISTHPSRSVALEEALQASTEVTEALHLNLVPDAGLDPSECRIFTETEVIEVGVDVLVDRLLGALAIQTEGHAEDADGDAHG